MALLPSFFLDAVNALGVGDDPAKRSWIGTGFLYGALDKNILRTVLVKHEERGFQQADLIVKNPAVPPLRCS